MNHTTVMHTLRRAALPIALMATIASIAGCAKINPLTQPASQSGSADFSTYLAMGTSISAGYQSGGLANRHQILSFPYLFAKQAGTPFFTYPSVNLGGWPPLLKLKSLGPPVVIDSIGVQRGAWVNIAQPTPYHLLAVPYALLADVRNVNLNYDPFQPRDVSFFNNILRQGQQTIPLTWFEEAISLHPTFVSFEFGSNEILGAAVHGHGTPLFPPSLWADSLHNVLNALDGALPNAKKAIFTVPDVTSIPFLTTLPPVELTRAGTPVVVGGIPKFLIGPGSGPGGTTLGPGDLLTLNAGKFMAGGFGYAVGDTSYLAGFPVPGNGIPLPDTVVLNTGETASIQAAVQAYNTTIHTEATARNYALVDLNRLLRDLGTNGFRFAGTTYTTAFVKGGLFSVDGVHPSDLAHGIICNELIDVVNAKWGARIPTLDLSKSMTASSSSLGRSRTESGMPLFPVDEAWVREHWRP